MKRRTALTGAIAAAALTGLSACATTTTTTPTVAGIVSQNDQFSTLTAALGAAGLVETLSGEGPFTVFAPTNAAFDALPAGTVDSLLEPANSDQLTSILTYHVVPGQYLAGDLAGQRVDVETVNGDTVHIDGTGGGVTVNGTPVTQADLVGSNGVVHRIGSVLMP